MQKRTADLQAAQTALLDAFNQNNDLAVTDGLTGVYNRPWFSKIYEGGLPVPSANSSPSPSWYWTWTISKKINDTWGTRPETPVSKPSPRFHQIGPQPFH